MANNTPEVRFEGFSGEWEERKLGEFVTIKSGWSPSNFNTIHINGNLFIKVDDLNYSIRIQNNSNMKVSEHPNYQKMKKGSTIFPKRGAAIMTNKVRILGNDSYMDTNMMALEPTKIDSDFLYTFIYKTGLYKIADTSTIPQINNKHIEPYKITMPDSKEQTKIGSFFKQLDDSIALQQQELDTLKQTKQGFLQKMFPKAGETVPEIRFPGFSGEWEKLSFNECFYFPVSTNSLSRAMLNYDKGEIKSVHYGDILVNYPAILDIKKDRIPYITDGKLEKYNSNLLENGDLIFADAAEDITVGKAVEVHGITDENLVSGLHTIVARSKVKKAEYFLGYYINSNIYQRQLLRLMQGSKVSAISKRNLQKTVVSFPNNIEEQTKIGSFFKQLDDTIALHQQELDALKETKKAFLQKMFV